MTMRRTVESTEPPTPPQMRQVVEAMLGDGPIDMPAFASLADPDAAKAREQAAVERAALDWPNLGKYQAANTELIAAGTRPDLVFMGDSITEAWPVADPELFSGGRVGRGISGQTSPQMLVRFWPDVIALKPRAVHLLCGTNDIAGNTGPTTPARYQACVMAMTELAGAHDIRVILGAIPPAARMNWRPGFDPKPWVLELNAWLCSLAADRGLAFADYHAALRDDTNALRPDFSHDGVHPTRRGYGAMREVLTAVL
jgi:lysophospholipase L1-like esterase